MTAWTVHLPTAADTCVRFHLRPRGDRDPWPFTLAVTALQTLGAEPEGRFRALGSGRGEPVIASQDLRWRGHALSVETAHTREGHEATLTLPTWDELAADPDVSEDEVWELVDAVAAAVDAERGAIAGIALLLPSPEAPPEPEATRRPRPAPAAAPPYRHLPESGLTVLLR